MDIGETSVINSVFGFVRFCLFEAKIEVITYLRDEDTRRFF